MRTVTRIVITGIIILSLLSCKKDDPDLNNIDNFPAKPGYTWTYLKYRDSYDKYDTITITVAGDSLLDDGTPVQLLLCNYPDLTFYYYYI